MSAITLKRWDAADDLRDEEDIAAYLAIVAEEHDPALLLAALGDVARARKPSG
jgi:probable addiction module antidote protein